MEFIWKPISFFLIMLVGYILKEKQFFHESDATILMKIIMNLTLPMAVIHAFSNFPNKKSYLWIVLIGLGCASIPLLLISLFTRNQDKKVRTFYLLNVGGFNIGCFAMPIIQGIFGNFGAAIACLFDTGNAIMMTGGSYAFTSTLLNTGNEKETIQTISKKFLHSIPFCSYMVMLILTMCQVKIPQPFLDLSEPLANANAFLAMLMLGIMFRLEKSQEGLKIVGKLIVIRLCFSFIMSFVIYQYLPFPIEIRKILAVVVFAPISALAPVYTQKCNENPSVSSFVNSVSILIGLLAMCSVTIFLGS